MGSGSVEDDAAVDQEGLAGHELGLGAGEEHRHAGHVVGARAAAEPHRFRVIDASQSAADVLQAATAALASLREGAQP